MSDTNDARRGITRRELLKGGLAASAYALLGSRVPALAGGLNRPKNVLFLMTDEHNIRAMSYMGHRFALTPNLDRLVRGGVTFTNAYCAHPVCTASRASLHTGMWPQTHHQHQNVGDPDPDPSKGLSADTTLMASVFHDNKFKTYHHGKWHIGDVTRHPCYNWNPRLHGYNAEYGAYMTDYNKKHPVPSDLPPGGRTDVGPRWCLYGWPLYETPKMRGFDENNTDWYSSGRWAIPAEAHETTFLTDQVICDLNECGKQPYMITWSDYGPHGPHNCPSPYYEMTDPAQIELPTNLDRPDYYAKDPSCAAYDKMGIENTREYLRCYYGLIRLIDDQIGRILKELEKRGELDDTLIVFTADHGDMCGAHKTTGGKAIWAFYDEITRVPLIMHWPKGIRGGRKVNTLVNGVDVMPTILDYSGLSIPNQCEGKSLRQFIDGREDMNRAAFCEGTNPATGLLRRMVRTQDWKLWIYCQGNPESSKWPQTRPMALYHISEDPGEERNLASDPAYAKVRKELVDRIISWMEDIKDPWLDRLPDLA
ncbi:MAG: sulfatase family protein [Armatimonadota bacterium]